MPLARNNPGAQIVAVEISQASMAQARQRLAAEKLTNARVEQADVMALPFADESFDHAFVCFLLEHLCQPAAALNEVRRVLKPGGTVTVIEGDHGSALFHPDHAAAHEAIDCQVELQRRAGGDAGIGRRLRPLIEAAGFDNICVTPCPVYVDADSPRLAEGFIRRTFAAMIASIREPAIAADLITPGRFDEGIAALERTAEPGGTFCYTFFKATARKG
ncbi:methyltransferase domain-containing protein [Hyphomicrobiales bacterium BP6-180914]|uniref:Methyltransferase domain-containing protein n=1 Tax=Lichenifustis flavocetrariae TaxID=2949735 RepID=A0AA41YXB0_9HYPH|nr:methyltransferase domain-containing protein [Lichenifustis flavocetrariae]